MRLKIAGYIIEVKLSDKEKKNVFVPLVDYIIQRKKQLKKQRLIVGISGIPGSGKTVFARILQRYINQHRSIGLKAKTVYLDGFHLKQDILYKKKVKTKDGQLIPLIRLKGSPASYDVSRARKCFRLLRSKKSLSLPEYDRNLHEPVENRVKIGPEHNIIIVEGNYLRYNKGMWRDFKNIFDLTIFVDIALEACRPKIIVRHRKGGLSLSQAWARYLENDYPNTLIISSTKPEADIIVKKNMRHRYTDLIIK